MTRNELFEVIMAFDTTLKANELPSFSNPHRAEQVLRILQSEFFDFHENESKRACVDSIRDRWEKFWTYPEVGEALAKWTARQAAIRKMEADV